MDNAGKDPWLTMGDAPEDMEEAPEDTPEQVPVV